MPKVRLRSDGARRLLEYLSANGLSIQKFCLQNKLDRVYVQRVLNGEQGQRVTVDFAHAIERATKRQVAWDSWRSSTLKAAGSVAKASGV